MFPIWDDQHHKGSFAPITRSFLVVNIIVFLHQASLSPAWFEAFVIQWWTVPALITNWESLITLLTNMFLHGSWMHLIGNMLFLYVFGDNIEKELGSLKFVVFYVVWWVAASMSHILLDPSSTIPAVWASWAIAALLWAYLIWFPKAKIKMLSPYWGTFLIGALQFLWYWIVVQIISGVWSLWWSWWWVAWWAHIGWFVYGVVIAMVSGWKRAKSEEFRAKSEWSWFSVDERVRNK